MAMDHLHFVPPAGYQLLRPLSVHSPIYLCKEQASERLLVLKFFTEEKRCAYLREAYTLHQLHTFPYSPQLLFSIPFHGGFLLGQEYIEGRCLHLMKDLDQAEVKVICEQLQRMVQDLHDDYGIYHGDLSPRNIIINEFAKRKKSIYLVDWEFAQKQEEENIESYQAYQGTLGFNPGCHFNLAQRDKESLKKSFEFLRNQTKVKPTKKKNWRLWN